MSLIVAARFTTFTAADTAIDRLLASGVVEEDVTEFYVNPGGQHARYPIGGDVYADPGAKPASRSATVGGAMGAVVGVVVASALSIVVFHSAIVLAVAAAVGAYVGSLGGAMLYMRGGKRDAVEPEQARFRERSSGVLVAAHVNSDTQQQIAAILRESGGMEIERATGRWQQGHWTDFDPTRAEEPLRA